MATFDEIGYWSEIKLHIVREYAAAYSRVLAARRNPSFEHVYIDAFAGAGVHVSRTTGEFVPGSPLNALLVEPPFCEYYFIDIEQKKIKELEKLARQRPGVLVFHGDCNEVLLTDVFPRVQWRDYRRGLCLLDPYGLHLDWRIIETAGKMRTIDMFLNFPIADMNRNVLRRVPDAASPEQIERMNRYWGDETWRDIAYHKVPTLFGEEDEKQRNEVIAEAFRERLRRVAGFEYVPAPMPMRNTQRAIVYYLFFASQRPVAAHIVTDIFEKHSGRMA